MEYTSLIDAEDIKELIEADIEGVHTIDIIGMELKKGVITVRFHLNRG
jgi:hypothetical protein